MQQAIGEDVTALRIGAELNLVDGEKVHVHVARHGFHRCHPEAGALRFDLLLTGNEGDLVSADTGRDLVVDLARQKPQRKTDHTAFVTEHALDGEMRLSGVGGAENRGHIADARFQIAGHTRDLLLKSPWHCIAGVRDQAFRSSVPRLCVA